MSPDVMLYIIVFAVALIAAGFQSSAGLGFAIICMSIWPLFMPFRTASVIETITVTILSLVLLIRLRKHIRIKLLIWPLITTVALLPLGVFTMMSSTESVLRRLLGCMLLLLSVYFVFFGQKFKINPTPKNGLIAGAFSGFSGGLFSMGGPPMALYCLAVAKDKNEYSSTLQAYFALTALYHIMLHAIWGNITNMALSLSVVGIIGAALGSVIGFAIFKRLASDVHKKVVYIFMIIFGFFLIIRG